MSRPEFGANGIVGGGLPIAVGSALSAKRLGKSDVTVCSLVTAPTTRAPSHEALNMASIWKLPLIFVCENNRYGMSTSVARSTRSRISPIAPCPIRCRASPSTATIFQPSLKPSTSPSSGPGPAKGRAWSRTSPISLARALQVRPQPLPDKDEIEGWMAKDPIARFRSELVAHGILDDAGAKAIEEQANREVDAGIEFAKSSPAPLLV